MKARKALGAPGYPPCVVFYCPGCGHNHSVPYGPPTEKDPSGVRWQFDQNFECPTISPSLRVFTLDGKETACHVVVTRGVLNYCGDCRHKFNGQSVPMVDCELDNRPMILRNHGSAFTGLY